MSNKIKLKNLINKIRQSLKISRFEKKQIFGCIDDVIMYFKFSTIQNENAKIHSKFLINFLHILASSTKEYMAFDEDDEEYSDRICILLSYFIDLEVKKFKCNHLEQLFAANVISKCRIICSDSVTIKALGKYLARNDFLSIFNSDKIKSPFVTLFEKILNTGVSKINQLDADAPYYHQIFITWLKLCANDDEMKTSLSAARALNLKVESFENGQIENVRQIILDKETQCDKIQSDNNSQNEINDLFGVCKGNNNDYSIQDISWFKSLKNTTHSANETVDLTIDSEDSEIEMELPIPSESIEIEDNQIGQQASSLIIRKITQQTTPRICIQERRTYISPSSDVVKKMSFAALRRRTTVANEASPIVKVDRRRRKSAYPRLVNERKEVKATRNKKIVTKPRRTKRLKTIDRKEINSNLTEKIKLTLPCSVSLQKISTREISQLRRKRLDISYFIEKYDVKHSVSDKTNFKLATKEPAKKPVKKTKKIKPVATKKAITIKKKRQESPKKLEFIDEISILEPDSKKQKTTVVANEPETIAAYPDHTKPNLSLLQVLSSPKSERKVKLKRQKSKSKDEHSISIVNWPIEQKNYKNSPKIQSNTSHVNCNNNNNFDAVSDNEQQVEVATETEVNTSLLEEILGTRANNYVSEIRASITSSSFSSRDSQSADELSPVKKARKENNQNQSPNFQAPRDRIKSI